jgi:hypothetical protein
MATNQEVKIEAKTILIVLVVLALVGFAAWRVMGSSAAVTGADPGFTTKIQAPPDSARPPGFSGNPDAPKSDKQ